MTKPRRIHGFAVFDHAGNLVWGTLRPCREETERLFLRHNPQVEGFETAWTIQPVAVEVDAMRQLALPGHG